MAEQHKINIRNKRATFDYEIVETFTAGIVLTGTEIKSLRASKASLTDCYCYMHVQNLHIGGARAPKKYHNRDYIKEKDAKREMDRAMKR